MSSDSSATGMHRFHRMLEQLSMAVTHWAGSSWAFALALLLVVGWASTGPLFNFSQTWQLFINTGTTIGTFLMVFLIQRSQNKESLAVQVKLNELLASQHGASNRLINVEDSGEEEIATLDERFTRLSNRLDAAADDSQSHSIAEARGAVDEADETLGDAKQDAKQNTAARG